ncbi:glycosyltransferase family protein [Falsiroseomonas oryziterrae]|uniref:hypothetical protein n=1 Tax=Falsiroseomonas oryziterrae TaxID=2911368 RepID=UPI001F33EEA6|nr:hypothetical protein [Roseomonas sp. NPKOSM-4]
MPDAAPTVEGRRLSVAVLAGWAVPVRFSTEGLTRLLGFLVQGAAESGRVTFHVCVRPVNMASARAMLESLRAREGLDWTLHAIEGAHDVAAAGGMTVASAGAGATGRLLGVPDKRIARWLFAAGVVGTPLLMARALLRPVWRFAWQHGLRVSVAAARDPVGAAPEVAVGLRRLRAPVFRRWADELERWSKERRLTEAVGMEMGDDAQDQPGPENAPAQAFEEPNWRVPSLTQPVDAWLSLFASHLVPAALPGRRAMIFADALALDFGASMNPADLGPGGALHQWFLDVRRNLTRCDTVVTFSRHVAVRHAVDGMDAEPDRIAIVPHAPPDLSADLPFLPASRRRTPESRAEAAQLLRQHAAKRRWRYLADFPLEHVDYIAMSTQERPSKNLSAAVEAVRILVQERHGSTKLLMTTPLVSDAATPYLRIAAKVRRDGLALDALSVPGLPAAEHAALYHAAALTVHPAFFEGGDAPFPFAESVSVGTPCLMARGPHTEELLESYPSLEPFIFDPYDPEALADLIERSIPQRDAILDVQLAAYSRMQERRWATVAEEYASAATGTPLVPVRRLRTTALAKSAGDD